MEVGSYVMDLYCDRRVGEHPDGVHTYAEYASFPHQFGEFQSRAESIREARRKGWLFKRDGTHLCPSCAKRKPTNGVRS